MAHVDRSTGGNGVRHEAGLGEIVRRARESKGWTHEELQTAIGGSPGAGFLARLEEGIVGPSAGLVLKLATAMDLSPDLMLNASGFTTEAQRIAALLALGNETPADGPH